MTTPSGISIFDADNHFYEPPEALTRHLPDRYRSQLQYVKLENGRTKLAVGGKISEYIPNPTFDVVARPGAQEEYYRKGNPEGKSRRELFGEPIKSPPAFREPASRLELMNEQGIDRTLMFPTLASVIEERMKHDPYFLHAAIHALNEWMYETWQFDYEDRIFSTPVITLPIVEKAIEELEWVARARRQGRADPSGSGARLPRHPLVRPARVRPVLEAGRRARHPRRAALLRQRLRPDRQLVGGQRPGDAAVPAGRVPHAVVVAADRGRRRVARRPRCAAALPGAQDRRRRERRLVGRAAAAGDEGHVQEDAAGLPRGAGGRDASQHLHQPVLGRGLRPARRAARRGPCAVRLGLPAPRGPREPGRLRERPRAPRPRAGRASSWAATSPS